ncbi:cilia and flagella-associated protein 47-like [Vespa velutina]|uniref:cilia and flagella-associated protein 47-like n=1 Tax=Vespa velutina TaxID=202808 RepID=UPI001FB243E7|nr:cilia and flagella-associated protein 47-like [Vespa velutina]
MLIYSNFFLLFIIKYLILEETFLDPSMSLTSRSSSIVQPVDNVVRLCLYGEMEIIKLNLQPDILYFGDLNVGEISQRVICISNLSKIESVSFQCQPRPAVQFIPKSAKLKPEGSIEVIVKVQARENVGSSFVLLINVIMDSEDSVLSKYPTKVKIGTYRVTCMLNVLLKIRKPMTQFVTGITPLITHEVGFMTECATFGSNIKKPQQAMLLVEKDPKRPWANKKLINANIILDSVPAYPNDTQKSLRPYRGLPVKTIFTGKLRYSGGPIHPEALSVKQANTVNKHRLYWAAYLHMSRLSRKNIMKTSVVKFSHNADNDAEIISRLTRIPKRFKELPQIFPCEKFFDKKPSISEINAEVLIPLSPLQIYNVYVYPTTIDFGMVAWKTFSYQQLIACNKNEFSIKIQFISRLKNIRFPEGDTIILQPEKTMTKLVEFYSDRMGKFNNLINYNINDNHLFELNVIAEIVHKDLSINKREIIIGKDYLENESYRPQWSIIQIRNKLDAPTCFKWNIRNSSSFYIEPKYGIIRGNSILNTYVSYNTDFSKSPFAEMVIKCESGTFSTLQCNVALSVKPKVVFVNNRTNLGDISLNLPSRAYGILFNSEFTEVFYEIDSASLIRGCEIDPPNGIIPPRGIAILEASFKFDVCIDFTVIICIIVQKHIKLQWNVTGSVPFPQLKFTPYSIEQHRVIVDTFQSHLITVNNIGTTRSKLQFLLEEYPEFSIVIIPNKKTNIVVEEETSVIIPAGSSMSFYLHFQPLDPASYVFYLPIVINDLLGPVLETDSKTLKSQEYLLSQKEFYKNIKGITFLKLPLNLPIISINFTVAGRAVLFNKFKFNFNVASDNVIDELRIDNPDTLKEVIITIKTDNFIEEDCPFYIHWSYGTVPMITSTSIVCTLLPREKTVFSIGFKPNCRGAFKLEALVFIRRNTEDILFNTIHFDGINAEESMKADVSEIYLLPVPFNTCIEERFKLKAQYFEHTSNISWNILPPDRCSGYFKNDMLTIRFPNNNIIPTTSYTELDVIVSFKSNSTVSFCTKIEFHAERSLVVCFVTVYAAADNNLLTTHVYLTTTFDYNDKIIYEKEIAMPVTNSVIEYKTEEDDYNNKQNSLYFPRQEKNSTVKSQTRISYQESSNVEKKLLTSKFTSKFNTEKIEEDEIDDNEYIQEEKVFLKQTQSLEDLSTSSIEISVEDNNVSSKIMYPYFPENNGIVNDYEQHMHAIFSIVNQEETKSSNNKKKNRSFGKSFVDVLELLIGSKVYNYVEKLYSQKEYHFNVIRSSLPLDDILRIDVILRQYERILDFLLEQGACLAHVSAYFLLNYNDYITFIDSIQFSVSSKKIESYQFTKLSKSLFESRSKQCWLDLILQTYKCFKLSRINENELRTKLTVCSEEFSKQFTNYREFVSTTESIQRMIDFHDKSVENVINLMHERIKESSDRSNEEVLLLSWLYHHYEEQRTQDWLTNKKITLTSSKQNNIAHEKNINNFDFILSDGLILIAVTGAYCPFLIDEYFSNLYINPKSIEEALHNAICLVTSWTKIRLGFMITPSQIVHPNSVQMLMLVVHLFETLPSYLPRLKIRFNCPLTKTVIKQVTFTNVTDNPVEYLLVFIGNDNGFFSLVQTQSHIRINAHDGVQVKICFHAKKIRKTKAYLLLCGAAYGPQFGINQTYILEGNINNLEVSQKHIIRSKLYQILNTILIIKIPYKNAADYEIWMTEEQPNNTCNIYIMSKYPSETKYKYFYLANLKMTKWSELRTRKVLRRLFLNQKIITVDEDVTEVNLGITVACVTPTTRKCWLICLSETGDFIIQIISRCQPTVIDHIVVQYNKEYKECICTDDRGSNADCPCNITVLIPSRNNKLWDCIAHMFQKTLNVKERAFWSRYLDTYIGLRLIHWFMGHNTETANLEFTHIFKAKVMYSVSASKESDLLTVPETLFIINGKYICLIVSVTLLAVYVRLANQYVPMIVHLLPTDLRVYETTLSLTSEDGKELRLYEVSFLHVDE